MALGAGRGQIVSLVARDATRSILPGIVFGVVAAVLLTRTMRTMLYGIGPTDPIAFAGALATLVVVAVAASVGPARRAARVDPISVMRSD
jgi:ABC-type antimicrobial peptide transport system permease subunit